MFQYYGHVSKIFLLALLCVTNIAVALPSDNKQPATIQSDTGSYNRNTNISILQGHVVIVQGTTKVTADKVIIYSDKDNKLQRAIAIGHPATYSTVQDVQKPPVVSTASEIDYNPQLNQVTLIGNAKVVQGTNSIASGKIVYNMKQQQVNTFPKGSIRTTLMFQPGQISNTQKKS
jgi:lipopolysaccharide export system protein LptA